MQSATTPDPVYATPPDQVNELIRAMLVSPEARTVAARYAMSSPNTLTRPSTIGHACR